MGDFRLPWPKWVSLFPLAQVTSQSRNSYTLSKIVFQSPAKVKVFVARKISITHMSAKPSCGLPHGRMQRKLPNADTRTHTHTHQLTSYMQRLKNKCRMRGPVSTAPLSPQLDGKSKAFDQVLRSYEPAGVQGISTARLASVVRNGMAGPQRGSIPCSRDIAGLHERITRTNATIPPLSWKESGPRLKRESLSPSSSRSTMIIVTMLRKQINLRCAKESRDVGSLSFCTQAINEKIVSTPTVGTADFQLENRRRRIFPPEQGSPLEPRYLEEGETLANRRTTSARCRGRRLEAEQVRSQLLLVTMTKSAADYSLAESATPLVCVASEEQLDEPADLGTILAGIDRALREWRSARRRGQSVLTELSNTLLLRTYIDKGKSSEEARNSGNHVGPDCVDVWGALARAGGTVSKVSIAAEARARQLHSELGTMQDVMLSAAVDIQRLARNARSLIPQGLGRDSSARDTLLTGCFRVSDVASVAAEVAGMLLKEALMTATITQGVAGCESRETLTIHAAAWMMEPYLDTNRVKDLQSVLSRAQSSKSK